MQDEQHAAAKQACLEDKDGEACLAWADMLKFKGEYKDALRIYSEQCDVYQSPMCCIKTADMYRKEAYGFTDQAKAQTYYKKGCDKGHALSCFIYAFRLTSKKYIDQPKYREALPYFEKGCDHFHDRACFLASEFYRRGIGTERDAFKALEFASRACDLSHKMGCINASRMTGEGDGVPQSSEVSQAYKDKLRDIIRKQLENKYQAQPSISK